MKLNLSIPDQKNRAETYFNKLVSDGSKIELKKIAQPRSVKQNSYLHALFTLYAGEWGWTMEEAKTYIKRTLNYKYEKNGEWFLSHTSDMSTKELSEFIEKFRNLSASQGFYLASPEEFVENYFQIMQQVSYVESAQKKYSF